MLIFFTQFIIFILIIVINVIKYIFLTLKDQHTNILLLLFLYHNSSYILILTIITYSFLIIPHQHFIIFLSVHLSINHHYLKIYMLIIYLTYHLLMNLEPKSCRDHFVLSHYYKGLLSFNLNLFLVFIIFNYNFMIVRTMRVF